MPIFQELDNIGATILCHMGRHRVNSQFLNIKANKFISTGNVVRIGGIAHVHSMHMGLAPMKAK